MAKAQMLSLAALQYIDLDTYQMEAKKFACYKSNMYPVLGLAEEAGEVAGKFAKYLRGDKQLDPQEVALELGDCLWMIANICEELDLDMSEVAAGNIKKLTDRAERNVIKGDGDTR